MEAMEDNIAEMEKQMWLNIVNIAPPNREEEYYSCHWIEGGLVFFPGGSLGVCCIPQNGRGEPKFPPFDGDRLPLDKILETRKKIIEDNQKDCHDRCKGCQYLIKQKWVAREYLFDIININHFTSCNLQCLYCFTLLINKKTYPPDVPTHTILKTFNMLTGKQYLSPTANILFGGGEPTLLDGFDELLSVLIDYGASYHICSNGTVLSNTILKALKNGSGQLLLGIDAGTRDVYKTIKGRDFFEKVWKNTQQYVYIGGKKVIAKIIIKNENINDVIPFVEMAGKMGVNCVCYDIDAYQPVLSEDIIKAAAMVRLECEKRGIDSFVGESGTSSQPGNRPKERIEEAYKQLKNKTPP